MTQDDEKLRILISIGGGPEAYTSLKFAVRLSQQSCADISLLYVRPLDSGLKSGGMEIRVARENVLDWGLELPGMTHLKKARDILIELGEISNESKDEWQYRELSGDPAGEYVREYINPCGGAIALRLRTASDITAAVIDEADRVDADIIIVGGSPKPLTGIKKLLSKKQLALQLAAHSTRSAIVARNLEPGHGHLVCVNNSDKSRSMLPKAIRYSHACQCPISILSVAETQNELEEATTAASHAADAFRTQGIEPQNVLVKEGKPVDIITEIGYNFSLIVLGESDKPWFAKTFSVSHDVAAHAHNSVMIIK